MDSYFENNNELKLVLILLDSRREISNDDQVIIDYVKESGYPYFIIVTKVDKINQKEKAAMNKRIKEQEFNPECVFYTSSLDNKGLNELKKGIEKSL
jgi:GTP-binding protein